MQLSMFYLRPIMDVAESGPQAQEQGIMWDTLLMFEKEKMKEKGWLSNLLECEKNKNNKNKNLQL